MLTSPASRRSPKRTAFPNATTEAAAWHASAACTITIDLAALAENWRCLAATAAPAECAAVVKADAYGIRIERAVPALAAAGCKTFFVALPDEGRRVRSAVPEATIYVLGGYFPEHGRAYREHDLRPVLNEAAELSAWADRGGGPSALQVDTGMNRLGFPVDAIESVLSSSAFAASDPRLLISHLACADEPAHPKNTRQLATFRQLRDHVPALPASFANSSGILLGPSYRFDLVRPGIALYGALP
jgi:alanine racemase